MVRLHGPEAVADAVVLLVVLAEGFDVVDGFAVADECAVAVGDGMTSTR